jgi:predicted transcriptional regulator
MSFLRHIGKMGDRKVAIIFREVPNEPHMCLVTYTETLNQHIHDPMMRCIESDIGQHSQNLADALNRTHTKDGRYLLQVLHKEGLIKKVQTSQVIITPNSTTSIKLEELNKILDEMEQGEAAVKRLSEMDASRGLQDPVDVARRMRGESTVNNPSAPAGTQGVLADNAIANNLLSQARKMEVEAKGLLAESARLNQEANDMLGIPTTTQINTTSTPTAKKRGRPAKATVTA